MTNPPARASRPSPGAPLDAEASRLLLPLGAKPIQARTARNDIFPRLASSDLGMPSLFPGYLPYKTQHLILTTAQRVLEECCFDFAKRWLPYHLESQAWDCPEAVEITRWIEIFKSYFRCNRPGNLALSLPFSGGRPASYEEIASEILDPMHRLRNVAVHRSPASARYTKELVESAFRFALMLRDATRAAQLAELHAELRAGIRAMESRKDALEQRCYRRLYEIRKGRAEPDRTAGEVVEEMLQEDNENSLLVGAQLEACVKSIFEVKLDQRSFRDSTAPAGQDLAGADGTVADRGAQTGAAAFDGDIARPAPVGTGTPEAAVSREGDANIAVPSESDKILVDGNNHGQDAMVVDSNLEEECGVDWETLPQNSERPQTLRVLLRKVARHARQLRRQLDKLERADREVPALKRLRKRAKKAKKKEEDRKPPASGASPGTEAVPTHIRWS